MRRFLTMTPTTSTSKLAWQAEVKRERRYYTTDEFPVADREGAPDGVAGETPEMQTVEILHSVREYFVEVSKPGGARISFRVNRRRGRHLTFTDSREQFTGTAGTRGPWGTLPEQPAGKSRSLTPTGIRMEVARLIGAERAEEIVRELMASKFLAAAN